jgi:hypothetical protein
MKPYALITADLLIPLFTISSKLISNDEVTKIIIRNNPTAVSSILRSVWEAVDDESRVNYLPAGRGGK